MKNSKLINSLQKLNPTERKKLLELVESPYFNKNEKVKQFAAILLANGTLEDEAKLDDKAVYRHIYPKAAYKKQRINDLMTYLYRLFEVFLAMEQYNTTPAIQAVDTLKGLRAKKLYKPFEKGLNELSHELRNDNLFAEQYYLNRYFIERESDLYFTAKDSRSKDKSIERKAHNLDVFYFTAKLKDACEMLNRQNIVNEEYDLNFIDEVMAYVAANEEKLTAHPAIVIYFTIYHSLKTPENEKHYKKLTSLLSQYTADIADEELRLMYDYAQNYCIKKINSGNSAYLREIFMLFKALLENGVIMENGVISEWDYKNIVTVGGRLREFDWTEQFIESYRDKLPDADQQNAYTYNLASNFYSRGDYDKAMRLLLSVEFTDLYYNLGSRSLLLKIYYEMDETEALYSLVEAFKIYLKRSKLVSKYQYTAHFNLVKFTRRLAALRNRKYATGKEVFKRDMEKLKKRIQASTEITNLNWLMAEVEKLETE